MKKFETHCHSIYSVDGFDAVADIYAAAEKASLAAVTITDHFEVAEVADGKQEIVITDGYDDITAAKARAAKGTKLLCGIEIGGIVYDTEMVENIIKTHDYDYILSSFHGIKDMPEYYEWNYAEVDINAMLEQYFTLLLSQAKTNLYDTMAHLDYPTRYIRRANIPCPTDKYFDIIDEILRHMAQNGKALEINTSGLFDSFNSTLPSFDIIKRWKQLGGEFVTFASDAHHSEHLARGFDAAAEIARQAGFNYLTYFEKRKPISVKID